MGYDDFEILGMSALDPTPDEEAWEAYLDFAHPILGGDDSLGLAAQDVRQALLANVSAMVAAGAWAGDWGERPAEDAALESAVAAGVAAAPVLLPLFEDGGC